MAQTVNQLGELHDSPYVVTVGTAEYPLTPLRPSDLAEAQRHAESIRLNQYIQAARKANLPIELHAKALADITCKPMFLQDMFHDWECVCFLLHKSVERGGAKVPYASFRSELESQDYATLMEILAVISGLMKPGEPEANGRPLEPTTSTDGMSLDLTGAT